MPGKRLMVVLGASVLVIVGSVGAAMGATGRLDLRDDRWEVAVSDAAVGYRRCPAENLTIASFHQGDRVYAVGRTEDGTWIAVRAPVALTSTVWVDGAALDPDEDLGGLPVVDCDQPPIGEQAPTDAAGTSTTMTPTTGGAGTTASTQFPSTTGEPPTSGGMPTTTGPPESFPSTTGQPESAGPAIGPIAAVPTRVFEDGADCMRLPRTATVRATVDDPSGIASVTLRWAVGDRSGEVMMVGSDTRTATVGPFPVGTVEDAAPVELVVEAIDRQGNRSLAVSESALQLEACP